MKYLKIIFVLFVTSLVSCSSDETGDVSRVTNYPIMTLNGDPIEFVTQGDAYNDPGATATEDGSEIPVETYIGSGTYYGSAGVDTSTSDQYFITYAAENQDGFSGSALREVWVVPPTGDLTTSIEGLYISNVQRVGSDLQVGNEYIIISKTGTNTYNLSHGLGGYYDLGRGYGPGYAALGSVVTANDIASNDFSITDSTLPIWGYTVGVTGFTVDAVNKTITYTGLASVGSAFDVELTQVQF